MFHSNQKLEISCEERDLAKAIDFAMDLSGYKARFADRDRPLSVIYQETPSGLYLIGSSLTAGAHGRKLDEGWSEYPFDYDPEILARVVSQWAAKQTPPFDPSAQGDGSSRPGILCRAAKGMDYDARKMIKNPHHAILAFSPCTCFYHK